MWRLRGPGRGRAEKGALDWLWAALLLIHCTHAHLGGMGRTICEQFPNACQGDPATSWISIEDATGILPTELARSTNLEFLDLGGELSGTLPTQWAALTGLVRITSADQAISGTLPPTWDRMHNIQWLELPGNSISGTLPTTWAMIPYITTVLLGHNSISGELPVEWWDGSLAGLTHLHKLHLQGNSLSGTLVPGTIYPHNLQELDLGGTAMSGTLPAYFGMMAPLTQLSIGHTPMSGTLPSQLGALRILESVNTTGSLRISGTLPTEFGALSQMTSLALSSNRLSGTLPTQYASIGAAAQEATLAVALQSNLLSGTLPSSWGRMRILHELVLQRSHCVNFSLLYRPLHGGKASKVATVQSFNLSGRALFKLPLANNRDHMVTL